jgi:nucleotide-binding universal stress UspA family protein
MTSHLYPPTRILLPTDLGATSQSALAYARYFHEQFGASVRVLHAQHFELPPYFSTSQVEALKRALKRSGKAAAEYVRQASEALLGFSPDVAVVENAPVEAILDASVPGDIDFVIMGTHGRHGVQRVWLGSVAERVLRRSRIPVLAVRQPPSGAPFRHILCPVNLTEVSEEALAYAADISKAAGSQLTVLHVIEAGEAPLNCPLVGELIRGQCRVQEVTRHGNAANTILEASGHLNPDLIVMGAERKSALMGELFSSTTASVMQRADAALLVVPRSLRAVST